jgi:hypothetical protein
VTAVAVGCDPMANPKFGRRFGSPPHEQQPRTSHLRADAVAVGCDPMANLKFERRFGSPPHEQQPRTSHLRADAGPCIAE